MNIIKDFRQSDEPTKTSERVNGSPYRFVRIDTLESQISIVFERKMGWAETDDELGKNSELSVKALFDILTENTRVGLPLTFERCVDGGIRNVRLYPKKTLLRAAKAVYELPRDVKLADSSVKTYMLGFKQKSRIENMSKWPFAPWGEPLDKAKPATTKAPHLRIV